MNRDAIEILKERAEALARSDHASTETALSLILFSRSKQLYGVRLGDVEGAGRLKHLSMVPGGPPWMLGAVQHRGAILTLLDLLPFWGLEVKGLSDLPTFIVLSDGSQRMGLLVEELLGVHEVDGAAAPYRGDERAGVSEIAHLSGQPVLVLSAARLFQDGRLKGA
jgi:purine-binding chemotaxis protein CheW